MSDFGLWRGRLAAIGNGTLLLAGRNSQLEGALVLAYHDVGDDRSNTTDYYISPGQFRRQLRAAVRWGLRFVDLAEITERLDRGGSVDGLAAIVFDDSLVGVHHHAMPVLRELDLPATVFTVSGELGTQPAWWPGAARVMTKVEVAEMAAAGFRISSHTRTHASLPSLSAAQRKEELEGSRAALEDIIGKSVNIFAYPFGHFDPATREAVIEAGYDVAYSFLNGRIVPGLDPYRLPRLNMWRGQVLPRLAYHVGRPAWAWPQTQVDDVGPRPVRRQLRLRLPGS
jgi:peptidoglycan/xylan/chitin deacetylase (PgdA/CDA1 family)